MDGWLDRRNEQWRSPRAVVAPLRQDERGETVCPLCARAGRLEALRPVVGAEELHGCTRSHRFVSLPLEGE